MYELVDNLDSIKLDKKSYLYADTETEGLYGKIRLVQLYQSDWDTVKIIDTKKHSVEDVYGLIFNMNTVWHNGAYDMTCFNNELGRIVPFKWDDTFLAGRLALPHLESFSLDDMLMAVHRRDFYAEAGINKKDMQKTDWSKNLTDKHYTYAALDVKLMPKLWQYSLPQVEKFSYKLDKLTVELMLKYQTKGMPVSHERLMKAKLDAETEIANYKQKLPRGFNVNSFRQVRSYLGLPSDESSDDLALAALIARGDERADWIRQCKKNIKRVSFITKFTSNDDRIYGHFNVATRSGRSNCSDQNLQQLPSSLKHVFHTDKYLVYADFSNLELRTFAAIVNEPVMVRKFREDADLHRYSASKLFGITEGEVTKTQRSIAKVFNFSSLYGAGVKTRLSMLLKQTGILLSEAEGKKLATAWSNNFPGVRPWQEENAAKWRRGERGYTALGRPYIAKLFTDQNNIQVQGSGSEVAKLAKYYMSQKLDIYKLCNFVHDSFTFECDTLEEAREYAKIMAECMLEAWTEASKNFAVTDLPMPVDAVVANNWYDCQEDKNLIYRYSISHEGVRSEWAA